MPIESKKKHCTPGTLRAASDETAAVFPAPDAPVTTMIETDTSLIVEANYVAA